METKPQTEYKVVIGMPVKDDVKAMTAQSIGACIIGAHEAGIQVIDVVLRKSTEIASARTWLVQSAIAAGATHLLFVDSDMVFPYGIIPDLLEHKMPIMGVEYNKRQFPLELVSKALTERDPLDVYEAQHAGCGIMLIDLSIFKKQWVDAQTGKPTPWFAFGRDSNGALAVGEDAWFCNSARDNGFQTFIDPQIKVGHIGEYTY